MRDHRFCFEVDATPREVWAVFWPSVRRGQVREHGDVRIEILHPGDASGEGLVRHCHYRVPRYLLSGGRARSWEWLTEVEPGRSWRYDGVGGPPFSRATGWTRIEDLGNGRSRVHFREQYRVENPLLRRILEQRVHRFISRDNDRLMKRAVERGVAALREVHG